MKNSRSKRIKSPKTQQSAAEIEAATGGLNTDAITVECPGLVEMAANMAAQNEELMDGTTAPVKAIIAQGEIVFAVWQDPTKACGVGLLLLKGDGALRETMAGAHPKKLRITGVKVSNLEMAVAADLTMGVHEKEH
jgi:hypothetical protein